MFRIANSADNLTHGQDTQRPYIGNEETCRLIRELAGLKGVSLTEAVTVAARNALERERSMAKAASAPDSASASDDGQDTPLI
jgi:hypothetical protein